MGRRTRKKTVEVTRLLRRLFYQHKHSTEDEIQQICEIVRRECDEEISAHDVKIHFRDKVYRECRKKLTRDTARHKNTFDISKLHALWKTSGGKMPARGDAAVLKLVSETHMSYDEVSQWFGQQRYKLKQAKSKQQCRKNVLMPYLLPDDISR